MQIRRVCPSDIQQREGRIVRQGNQNPQVKIFRYMTSKSPVRSADDIDEAALSYAEVKALASGNPLIKEKMQLDNDVSRLKLMKSNYQSQVYQMQDDIAVNFPKRIASTQEYIAALKADMETAKGLPAPVADEAIVAACTALKDTHTDGEIGSIGGFTLKASYEPFTAKYILSIQGKASRTIEVGKDGFANVRKVLTAIANIPSALATAQQQLETLQQQLENTKAEVDKPFPKEQELAEKLERLSELNRALDNGQSQTSRETSDIVADQPRKPSIRDRLQNAQRESQRQQTTDRVKHRNNTLSL